MSLITRSDDERLPSDDKLDDLARQGFDVLRERSLRAMIAERDAAIGAKEKAEGALCGFRDTLLHAIRDAIADAENCRHIEKLSGNVVKEELAKGEHLALRLVEEWILKHPSAPCPHEEEAKMFKERYELEQIRYEGISSANEELRTEAKRLRELLTLQAKRMMNTCPEPDDCDKGCSVPEEECYGKAELRMGGPAK